MLPIRVTWRLVWPRLRRQRRNEFLPVTPSRPSTHGLTGFGSRSNFYGEGGTGLLTDTLRPEKTNMKSLQARASLCYPPTGLHDQRNARVAASSPAKASWLNGCAVKLRHKLERTTTHISCLLPSNSRSLQTRWLTQVPSRQVPADHLRQFFL